MRMKVKPKNPTNPIVRKEFDVRDWKVSNILDHLDNEGISYEDAMIETELEDDWCGSSAYAYLTYNKAKHTDEEFVEILKKYEKRLVEYNSWYAENREEIEKRLKEKERKEIEKKLREKKKLEKQLREVEERLKKLG